MIDLVENQFELRVNVCIELYVEMSIRIEKRERGGKKNIYRYTDWWL